MYMMIWSIGILFYVGLSYEPGSLKDKDIDWMQMFACLLLWPILLGIHVRGLVHKD